MLVHRPALPAAVLAAVLTAAAAPLSAQWPRHRSASPPRGGRRGREPAGAGAADAGRHAGPLRRMGERRLARAATAERRHQRYRRSPGTRALLTGGPGLFFDIAAGVAGGLPLQPWAAELKRQRMAANSKDNPDAHCLPLGNLQLHTHPQPRKIIQTRRRRRGALRRQRRHPAALHRRAAAARQRPAAVVVRLLDRPLGRRHAGGRDTRVPRRRLARRQRQPAHRSRPGRRSGTGARATARMEVEVTVDDPKAYTRPWTVHVAHRLLADDELIEFVCLENERSTRHFQ